MNRCLSDDELSQIITSGPLKLLEHSDDFAHQHLAHDRCHKCIDRLSEMIIVYLIADGAMVN